MTSKQKEIWVARILQQAAQKDAPDKLVALARRIKTNTVCHQDIPDGQDFDIAAFVENALTDPTTS